MKIAIIGGGAAGFFTAINIAGKCPKVQVQIFERSKHLLSKVRVSGGGRCNVTNGREKPSTLTTFYPRGSKKMYDPLKTFGTRQMMDWLDERGVETKVEDDLRVFPKSNQSSSIIDCFLKEAGQLNIEILTSTPIVRIEKENQIWKIQGKDNAWTVDKVVFAPGASEQSWKVIEQLGLKTVPRVPSLFTFNIQDERLIDLPGLVFEEAQVKVVTTKLIESGPLLITHWGLSGPAILKLSAWGAEFLHDCGYRFDIMVNLINSPAEKFRKWLIETINNHGNRTIGNLKLDKCPSRYFIRVLDYCQIGSDRRLSELSKKNINKIVEELTQARFSVNGKSTFKEEFVTCGGVDLNEIDLSSMACKKHNGLYLAGETLNIDALTGGFNFQACWTAGWLISEHIKKL